MKAKVITILAEGKRELRSTREEPSEGGRWEEEIFDRLTPYLRSEFPEKAIAAILARAKRPCAQRGYARRVWPVLLRRSPRPLTLRDLR